MGGFGGRAVKVGLMASKNLERSLSKVVCTTAMAAIFEENTPSSPVFLYDLIGVQKELITI